MKTEYNEDPKVREDSAHDDRLCRRWITTFRGTRHTDVFRVGEMHGVDLGILQRSREYTLHPLDSLS